MAYFITPPSLTTMLQAVNVLIDSLGEAQVDTLEDPTSDVLKAISALNEADLAVQDRGWNWNRVYALRVNRDQQGRVVLPDETLRVTLAYYQDQGDSLNVTQRGSFLFDLSHNTYNFTEDPLLDMVVRLDWEYLPQAARRVITLRGAKLFHSRLQGVPVVLQVNDQEMTDANLTLEQHEDEEAKNNAVNGNPSVVSALYGTGGMRRNRSGR